MEQDIKTNYERLISVSDREAKLIEFIRTLKFETMLSAAAGISSESSKEATRVMIATHNGYKALAADSAMISEDLKTLSKLLSESNEDYCKEMNVEDQEGGECLIN
ncbi:hypothetical protein [Paenibacillus massiliensis]|uniref:hypothetical protein n=1 Tax=Paenibacillus massiliensis TaxID=225917 RepID=UPI000472FB06|nr:hypothetical protein [Paenibacillus massiliensis]